MERNNPHRTIFIALAGCCLCAVFIFVYWNVFLSLINAWLNVPAYSHGFLVPIVSLYIIWVYRNRLSLSDIKPNLFIGTAVLLVSGSLLVLGEASMINVVQQVSMLVAICGIVILLLGSRFMRVWAVPLLYLVLMLPVLDGLFRKVQLPFQLLSAKMAVAILQVFDIPVLLSGKYIELPTLTLEVARACSGIQYMVSIVALVIPLMFIFLKGSGSRILLMFFAFLIGVSVNWLRIVLIALWVYNGGEGLHGPGHILQGLFVSVFGFFTLFMIAWIIAKISGNQQDSIEEKRSKIIQGGLDKKVEKRMWLAWGMAISILVGASQIVNPSSIAPVKLKQEEYSLIPEKIGTWQSIREGTGETIFNLDPDLYLERTYLNRDNENVNVYIGYFERQEQGREVVHSNLQSLYDNSQKIRITLDSKQSIDVNKAILKKENKRYLVIYWYNINGRLTESNVAAKIISVIDSLVFRRANAALIGFSVPLESGVDENKAYVIMVDLIESLFPFIESTFSS